MEKLIQEGILNGKSESQILKEMLQEELPQIEKNSDNKYLDAFLKDDYKIFDSLKGLKAEQRNITSIDPKVILLKLEFRYQSRTYYFGRIEKN